VCEGMGSSLWFLASLFENMPRARDSGHPGRPRKTVLPDAAFREANGVGAELTSPSSSPPTVFFNRLGEIRDRHP
jgi:hypothetical protein